MNYEHKIDNDGEFTYDRSIDDDDHTFLNIYSGKSDGTYQPRSILVDTKDVNIERARKYNFPGEFSYETNDNGCSKNFSEGYYGSTAEKNCDTAIENIRKEAEKCDTL